MPVGLEDRVRRLTQEVELAELVRHPGQRSLDRPTDRGLPVADHPQHRHADRLGHLAQQRLEILRRGREQAARQQHLAREAVTHHPEHLVPDIRLQAIERQDDPALPFQHPPQRRVSVRLVASNSS